MKPISELSDAELAAEAGRTRHLSRKEGKKTTAKILPFSQISAEPIKWLWPGRMALGKLSIFAGDPGLGKSQASLDAASRLSTGFPFPDGSRPPVGDTLILTSEDDPGDTIRPRLDAIDADVSRIHFLRCKVASDGSHKYPSILDLEVFRDAADQIAAGNGRLRLLIIDPIEGFLAGADAYKNAEVREVLGPLVSLAGELEFSILGVQHLNKGNGNAAYRVSGSIAFTAQARAVWVFARDPKDKNRRLFLCLKNNLGTDQDGLEYRIEEAPNGAPRIQWLGPSDDDVRSILAQERPRRDHEKIAPEQDRVLEFMKAMAPAAVKLADVAEAIEKTKQATSNILTKLSDQGLIKRSVVYGFWELSPPTPTNESNESSVSSVSGNRIEEQLTSLTLLTALTQGTEGSESSQEELEIF